MYYYNKYIKYKKLYLILKAGTSSSDSDHHMMEYLDNKDSKNFSHVDVLRRNDNKIYMKNREIKYYSNIDNVENYLKTYQYSLFSYYLYKYVNLSDDPKPGLNHLLAILFNECTNLPAIWDNSSGGYYDIRYLFDLVYYGGRIKLEEITNIFSKTIYVYNYHKILNVIVNQSDIYHLFMRKQDIIKELINEYPYDTTFRILSEDYTPYPKNEYNERFVRVKDFD